MMCDCVMINSDKKKPDRNSGYDASTRTYRIYIGMRYRCNLRVQKTSNVPYRKQQLKISKDWSESYLNFLQDMGLAPEGKSIDRIDNSLGYCKHNCRWASSVEQIRNRGVSKWRDLPLGVNNKGEKYYLRRVIEGKEMQIYFGFPVDTILASYLFICLEKIYKGNQKIALDVFYKMVRGEILDYREESEL